RGVPLFADLTSRFCVQVYSAQLVDHETRERLVQVLERERPAHTAYHLCIIKPPMRVGFQAGIGIDSIVAGPTPGLVLGEPAALGAETVLSDQYHRTSRRLGEGMAVGATL